MNIELREICSRITVLSARESKTNEQSLYTTYGFAHNEKNEGNQQDMTAKEMWKESGLAGEYEAWAFGEAPDQLALLVKDGIKTATCSAYDLYQHENESLPKAGEYSVILNSRKEAVCIIQTTKVYVAAFDQVTAEHAFKEGEGDRSLEYWRKVHESFLQKELAAINRSFDRNTRVVCEEFKLVYAR